MPPRDMQGMADVLLLAIKAALAPVQAELATLQQKNVDMQSRLDELSGLRDRVTVVETKAVAPPAAIVEPPVIGPSLADMELLVAKHVAPMGERITRIEERPAPIIEAPIATGPSLAEIELTLTKSIGPLSERLARIEERAPVPGPAGKDGSDGLPGKDGADGLGFDDLIAVQTDDRSFTIKAQRGELVKDIGTARFPVQIQRGVYAEGKSYEQSDVVTWAGSQWHCNEPTTTRPGEGTKAWTLVVKRGRDGKDGQNAPALTPVKVR